MLLEQMVNDFSASADLFSPHSTHEVAGATKVLLRRAPTACLGLGSTGLDEKDIAVLND